MNTFARRMADRRRQLGLSQEELAHRLESNQRQISRYENGQNDPTVRVLLSIARALDTTPAYLIGASDNPDRPYAEDDLTEDERALLEIFRSKNPDRRHNIVEILKLVE